MPENMHNNINFTHPAGYREKYRVRQARLAFYEHNFCDNAELFWLKWKMTANCSFILINIYHVCKIYGYSHYLINIGFI